MNEREIIELLAGRGYGDDADLYQGIGDDCAVIRKDGGRVWLGTIDTLVESVHFDLAWHHPEELGRKTIAVNVSDIAAMGGTADWLMISLTLPRDIEVDWVEDLYRGLADSCRRHGVQSQYPERPAAGPTHSTSRPVEWRNAAFDRAGQFCHLCQGRAYRRYHGFA